MSQPASRGRGAQDGAVRDRFSGLLDAAARVRSAERPVGDLLETLSEEEEKVLRRYWPEGRPSGEGTNYFDEAMRMRLRRLRWKLRFETGGELVWLLGKLMGVITVGAVTWNALLG